MHVLLRHQTISLTVISMISVVPLPVLSDDREAGVRTAIQAFYKAFDEGFTRPADYATEDWTTSIPMGDATSAAKQP
jgi:hypothetical protein